MAKSTKLPQRRKKPGPVRISESRLQALRRPVVLLILCFLLLAGIASRIHLLGRSLWLDEAWVANSMQAPTLSGAFFYEDWLQTSPPLFIALGRVSILLLGTSSVALRFLPAFAGILAMFLFAVLAFKFLRPIFALIALLLFIVSPRVIVYSQSLKQYSSDVLATTGLLVLGLFYLEKRSDQCFWALLAGAVFFSFLSYSAMLFFPFVLFCAFAKSASQSPGDWAPPTERLNWLRGVSATALASSVCLTNYFIFIAPNKNSTLSEFFQDGFPQGSHPADLLNFYWNKFATLPQVFFFGGPGPLRIAALSLTALGFVYLWPRKSNLAGANSYSTSLLFTAPIAGVVVLNLFGVFPLPGFEHRVLLFLVPIIILLFCFGLQTVVKLTSRLLAAKFTALKVAAVESVFGAMVLFAMAGLAWLFFITVGLRPSFAEEQEDSEEAVAYLRQHVEAVDILFVHATMREQFKLYTRAQPIAVQRIIFGKVGMPCCPRSDYRPPQQESEKDFSEEITALKNAATGRRLWILMTNRRLHWIHMRRNDIEIFERRLASDNCQKLGEEKFTGVYVAAFGCK
jgi:hypothetical protein